MTTPQATRRTSLRPFVLGFAAGGRSTAGLAALALTTPSPHRTLRIAVAVGAGGELVVDKLPMTPSRLEPPGLIGRGVLGTAAAVGLARRRGESQVAAALLGLAGVAAGTATGAFWRAQAHHLRLVDFYAGLGEDLAVAALAAWACQP